ncbi:hypothetical protein FJU08_12150 [Martelella alba]|uniref:Uncharacterized protein n=1 Tax=Martelella alba TaxID=2590451 RepID=A0A506U6R2_9HYPH|nr:hypothetical protein [Martelella alba]TPW30073.1 hypothetical protein FJU08_12150 [Martelella alba]
MNGTADDKYRGLFAYGWDIAEMDDDRFVDEAHRLGLNTITYAAAYHAGKFTRPKGVHGKIFFPEDGRTHFRSDASRYEAIKPETSGFAAGNDLFERLCARSDVAVSAWTVLLHNSFLGAKHPDCVVENAFGDRYVYSLCPSNPAVRAYARNLCCDVANSHDVEGLTLETPGFLPFRHGYHHEFALLGSMPGTEMLLGLCFCEHCENRAKFAGIDVAGLRGRVKKHVAGAMDAAYEPHPATNRAWVEADLVLDADLAAYHRMRCEAVTSLVGEIREAVRKDASIHIIPSVNQPVGLCYLEGSDLAALSKVADGLEVCFYTPPAETALTELSEIRARTGDDVSIRAVLRPGVPDYASEGGFAATVAALENAGVSGFGFYNYGHVRASGLEWVGRAMHGLK